MNLVLFKIKMADNQKINKKLIGISGRFEINKNT